MKTTALLVTALCAATWLLAHVLAKGAVATIDDSEKLRILCNNHRIVTHHKVIFAICCIGWCASVLTPIALLVTVVMWMAGA